MIKGYLENKKKEKERTGGRQWGCVGLCAGGLSLSRRDTGLMLDSGEIFRSRQSRCQRSWELQQEAARGVDPSCRGDCPAVRSRCCCRRTVLVAPDR